MNKNSRVIAVALFIIALFFAGSYFYLIYKIDNLKHEKFLQTSEEMKNNLQDLIKEKSEAILLVTLGISANQNIKNFIKHKEYSKIQLTELVKKLEHYSSLQKIWLQLITPDGKSFYRSWNDKRGDDLLAARKELQYLLKEPKVMTTISTGKYDITFKAIVPIYEDGEFVGMVETIAKFFSIVQKMKARGSELLVVVDKSYKKQLEWSNQTFIDDYFISNPFQSKRLYNIVRENSLENYLSISTYLLDKENALLITTLQLPDVNENPMGYFILAKDLDSINLEDIQQAKYSILEVTVMIFLLIFIIVYYLYSVKYKRFIEEQNELLISNVEEKTKELEMQKEVLTFVAYHDSLTGLANRVLLLDRIEEALKRAKNRQEQFAVFFLDLDNFKEINDIYGHEVGDELLLQLKIRLKKSIKSDDTLARLGGDEFAILHTNATQASTINIIDTILIQMKRAFVIKNIETFASFSIGVSMYPQDSQKASELLRNAETAMYKAKDNGKNKYTFYDKRMTQMALERIQLDANIRKALKNREFIPYFQPKIDAKNGNVVGLETLIRWQHPTKGVLSPGAFIPFCEETDLILELDKYMLIESIKQVKKWKYEGLEFGKVSVNVSTKKLESSNYIEELSYIIESLDFDTSSLELEILESQIMKDPQKSIRTLNEMRNLGISISIDDFGTGYSSLSYLKKLPVNKIKIDRSFVMDIPQNRDDVAIVRTVISLAKNLNLDIIAEGVETEEQLQCLLQEGCHIIQGYYFSKPLSVQACREFIVNHMKG